MGRISSRISIITILGSGYLAGCGGGEQPMPLDASKYIRPSQTDDVRRGPLNDRATNLYDNVGVDLLNPNGPGAAKGSSVTGVSDAVNTVVNDSAPARGLSRGTVIGYGSVIVDVNGTAIFAHKVLSTIEPILAAKAKDARDEKQFKAIAREEVTKQVQALIRNELEFAAAQRSLDNTEKGLADYLTTIWRTEQIRKAGGSLQLARQKATADGIDFDEAVGERYKLEMRRVYYEKRERPKIQVTADDLRHYYDKQKSARFAERAQAQFSVIKISINKSGGLDQAKTRMNEVVERARIGETFSDLAGVINDDPMFQKSKGDLGLIDKGAYANTALEDAVWATPVGKLTPVVQSTDALFIAKVEKKTQGTEQAFDDPTVQREIRRTLEAEQFQALRNSAAERLRANAIISPDPPLYDRAIDMAMQRYAMWKKG